ncbi:MAG: flavodoxin family protein [Candidatus Hermodarchaeota archaeon]|nr:flavodoxin family protein [Candidatus Hermodarchaeota archaeon]
MKILALNSSPRKQRGGTGVVLNTFLEGAREAGAEVDQVLVHDLDIKPCLGCFACWVKTPGQCVQKDDMSELLVKRQTADAIVLATPVYVDGMTSTLKVVLDRSIPAVHPFFEVRDDHCRHPPRSDQKPIKVVLVSVSGFTELDNFNPLVMHVKAYCKNLSGDFAGAVLRPLGAQLHMFTQMGLPIDDVFAAIKQAGRELVETGTISMETQAIISREIIPRDEYIKRLNAAFQQQLDVLQD